MFASLLPGKRAARKGCNGCSCLVFWLVTFPKSGFFVSVSLIFVVCNQRFSTSPRRMRLESGLASPNGIV